MKLAPGVGTKLQYFIAINGGYFNYAHQII